MTGTTSSFKATDGANIVYELTGDKASARRVVLVHSLAMDHAYWRPVAERLAKAGACAVALDCRGHGASDKPKGPYSMDRFADDLRDLQDHLAWDKAVIGGSSMGGSVTLAFAVRHLSRVAGLALIDTTAWYGEDAPKTWAGRANAAIEKGLASLIDFQLTRWFGDAFKDAHPEVMKACIDTFLKNDVPAYAATCNMLGNFDLRAHMSLLKVPTRVVVGEEDYATPPAMAQSLHQGIAGSTYLLLPKARHLTPLERPDEVAIEILATLKSVHG
jgi:3-oxoadipate enol-lactonase